jgi:hypothetical protein
MASKIVHRGTLTLDKLKELCFEHLEIKSDSDTWNPNLNDKIISLRLEEDGNWKGFKLRNGTLLETREATPDHALVKLLTHN